MDGDVIDITTELSTTIRYILTDAALQRYGARTPGGGLELWRRLNAELLGDSEEATMARLMRFQNPDRAANLGVLGDRLHAWDQCGNEVEAAGEMITDMHRRVALAKLVPTVLADEMAGRPDLRSYRAARDFIKHRLMHYQATAQAAAVAKNPDAMQLGNLEAADAPGLPGSSPGSTASSQDWTP